MHNHLVDDLSNGKGRRSGLFDLCKVLQIVNDTEQQRTAWAANGVLAGHQFSLGWWCRNRVSKRWNPVKMMRLKTSFSYRCNGELVSAWARIGVNIILLIEGEVLDLNFVVVSGHWGI